ncbi:MAG TPA: LacI family DNA-binding transcriptional regulator, partial [Candidatus Hydrogenedentes bacterium]|nr:LacI family DNA-binding transcriptional regulator [Candidatus Hydrogenedentota bacterium]
MERQFRKTRAKRPKTRLTIFDVAREAGVSTKTVSKVMNHQPGVSDETRNRVLKVVRELGYYPHYGARSLRAIRRNCIGVAVAPPLSMVPLREDFLVWLLAKLSTTFSASGAYLTFDTSRLSEGLMIDYGRGVWERMYDLCFIIG